MLTDAVQLVNCSKSPTGNSEVPATNGCGCPLHIEFSGGGRPQVSTSSETNDRPAELSEIRGCYKPRRHCWPASRYTIHNGGRTVNVIEM